MGNKCALLLCYYYVFVFWGVANSDRPFNSTPLDPPPLTTHTCAHTHTHTHTHTNTFIWILPCYFLGKF